MAPSAIKGSHTNIQPRLVNIAHASRLTCLGKASCFTTQAHTTGRAMACVVALVTFDDLSLSLSLYWRSLVLHWFWTCLWGGSSPPHTHWMAHGGPVRSCFVKAFPGRLPPAKPPLRIAFGTALGAPHPRRPVPWLSSVHEILQCWGHTESARPSGIEALTI